MKQIAKRSAVCLLLVALLLIGMVFYVISFLRDGGSWVSFSVNRHVYDSNAQLKTGLITDCGGEILADMRQGGHTLHPDGTVRAAVLHAVGDADGNIGTGALTQYAVNLMGYDPISGVFSPAGNGGTLRLSIDAELSAIAFDALAGRKGAVFFYNYQTGDILTMVSGPSFDPLFPPDDGAFASPEYEGAYINRCLSSVFTPGSVFKTVTLAAAIESCPGLFDMRWNCKGFTVIDGETVNCAGLHGELDIRDGFALSCNVVFAELAQLLGGEVIAEQFRALGLSDSFQISGIPVNAGSFDIAADGSADLSWSAIGQHDDLCNPAAVARMMGAIASGGVAVTPRAVGSFSDEYGLPSGLRYQNRHSERLLSENTALVLAEMLRYNADSVYADYHNFSRLAGLAAKSGTAEMSDGRPPHAWFAGFLADSEHPVAFAVMIENGGSGLLEAGAAADSVLLKITGR